MNKFSIFARTIFMGTFMFSGFASAAIYSPTTLTPLPGEFWSNYYGSTGSTGNFSDTYDFRFNAPAVVSFSAVGSWGTTFSDFTAEWVGAAPSTLIHTDLGTTYGDRWSGSFATMVGTTYSLKISQLTNGSAGGYYSFALNGAPIAAVPEPETLTMLLAGLGFIGLSLRRRRHADGITHRMGQHITLNRTPL